MAVPTTAKANKAAAVTSTSAAAATTTGAGAGAGASTTFIFQTGVVTADPSTTVYNLPTGSATFTYGSTPTNGGPNSPGFASGGNTSGNTNHLPTIIGVTVAGIIVIAIAGLLIQRVRTRSRATAINSHQNRNRNKANQVSGVSVGTEEERDDRAKLAKSFTIRRPPSVYVEDDQDLDQTGHPRFKSASDATNHPYYGGRSPGLVEYELSDTSGQKYGPASIAERKRYVEQQQRKVMDEYEMFNPHKDAPPASPYPPSQLTSAPSYTSNPRSPVMTPSMGGRSPRVQQSAQSPTSFSFQDTDYKY
ncbi:hypothetical protein BGZ46_004564 [Entomortierella lignicola]|nr:hypothetical protein BGZ46_004564 [Entomortierella lignicola]